MGVRRKKIPTALFFPDYRSPYDDARTNSSQYAKLK